MARSKYSGATAEYSVPGNEEYRPIWDGILGERMYGGYGIKKMGVYRDKEWIDIVVYHKDCFSHTP